MCRIKDYEILGEAFASLTDQQLESLMEVLPYNANNVPQATRFVEELFKQFRKNGYYE